MRHDSVTREQIVIRLRQMAKDAGGGGTDDEITDESYNLRLLLNTAATMIRNDDDSNELRQKLSEANDRKDAITFHLKQTAQQLILERKAHTRTMTDSFNEALAEEGYGDLDEGDEG